MRIAILASVAALALAPSAASARTYVISIVDTANDQTNYVAEPFVPHYGYTGGPVQSWGFGANIAAGGGWLDFFPDGKSLIHEATSHGNDFFQTRTPFYSLIGGQLSFLAQPNTGPQIYILADRGTLSVTAVPEPSIWAMMIAGFGLVGYGLRNRKRATLAHA